MTISSKSINRFKKRYRVARQQPWGNIDMGVIVFRFSISSVLPDSMYGKHCCQCFFVLREINRSSKG